MAVLQGLAFYEGIRQVVQASYTMHHGITAGTATLEIAPQDNFPALVSDLVFTFANVTMTFPQMALNIHSIRRNRDGKIWTLSLFDRRWKWNAGSGANGPLVGAYNVRLWNDQLDPDRKQTAQQLAILCLQTMGETNFDVSQMPNFTYPPVAWDCENAAQALANIAETEGCRVVLRLDNSVQVAKTGVGGPLPDYPQVPVMENTQGIKPPQRPDSLLVCCGRSRFQVDIPLQAVGMDIDGSIQPINSLSYKPANGWGKEGLPDFWNVSRTASKFGPIPQQLAKDTVFRWYRISPPFEIPLAASTGSLGQTPNPIVNDLRQVLPIYDEQNDTFLDTYSFPARVKPKPAWVLGTFYDGHETFSNVGPYAYYHLPFSIDRELGIVKFNEAVFQYDQSGNHAPATLLLRTAISFRDPVTWAFSRYMWGLQYPNGQWGTGPRVLKHEEIAYLTLPIYSYDSQALINAFVASGGLGQRVGEMAGDLNVLGMISNEAAVLAEANYYLQAADLEYQIPLTQSLTYAGLVPVSPDGAIQQVTWNVSCQTGATTQASLNNEFDVRWPPYRERRFFEDLRSDWLERVKDMARSATDPTFPRAFNKAIGTSLPGLP